MTKAFKISLFTAGMVLAAGGAFADDGKSILGAIDTYSAISHSEMDATKGTYYKRTAKAFADATSDARGRKFVYTNTYTDTQACTINCGGGGVSASSTSYSTAIAR
jgi:hypothetical protein